LVFRRKVNCPTKFDEDYANNYCGQKILRDGWISEEIYHFYHAIHYGAEWSISSPANPTVQIAAEGGLA
jgi:hypothetical protein